MKAAAPLSFIALLAASAVATEFNPSPAAGVSNVHGRMHVSHSKMRRQASGKQYKRCKPKSSKLVETSSAPLSDAQSTPVPTPTPTPTPTPAATPTPEPTKGSGNDNNNGGGNTGGSGDVINVKAAWCGDSGAYSKTSKTTGPNGSETWLNCGIENGGWNPPTIKVSDLKYKDLTADLSTGNSIFNACNAYKDIIYDAAGQYGLPAIMIASIMMQESSCNKNTVGGGGEQGLMQITHDKCGGAPNGDCKEPWFNIHTGAKYLADQINGFGGNVLLGVASYNGWYKGLTYDKATAARWSDCCRCQNNLDYPHQFFNGWMQGIDAYSTDLGTYKNLAVCGN